MPSYIKEENKIVIVHSFSPFRKRTSPK